MLEKIPDDIVGIIVFGSNTNGSADEFSDIDVVVVTDSSETANQVYDFVANTFGSKLNIDPIPRNEFQKLVEAGNLVYRYEVLHQGQILYDATGDLARLRDDPQYSGFDFRVLEGSYRHFFERESDWLTYFLDNTLDRFRWAFTYLACLHLSREDEPIHGLEELYLLMERDDDLARYARDLREATQLAEDYKHRRIPYPFEEIGRIYQRLQEMKKDILGE